MPVPSSYDDGGTVFRVDPNVLWQYATVDLPGEARGIADAVGEISSVWQGLKLGWFGASADEAQDFSNQLNTTLSAMFGSDGDPSSGILNQIANAVGGAAVNFAEAEDAATRMFDSLTGGLSTPGPGGPPTRSSNDGPVTENTPSW